MSAADSDHEAPPVRKRQTWVTPLAAILCIGVHIGLLMREDLGNWEALAKFGYLPPDRIWDGGYWALITSAFVHLQIWHLAFNVYWLWILGSRMEVAIGWWRYLAFYLVAALISSSCQLALSGETGIGASGVVYAIFGFMWAARHRHAGFAELVNERIVRLFTVWLVACVVLTHFNILQVGNAAHASGLLFGLAVAGAGTARYRALAAAGAAALAAFAIVTLFWCPWSVGWLSHQAYREHAAEHFDKALDLYNRILTKDPQNAWAYLNRSQIRTFSGDAEGGRQDLGKARELDPSIKEQE